MLSTVRWKSRSTEGSFIVVVIQANFQVSLDGVPFDLRAGMTQGGTYKQPFIPKTRLLQKSMKIIKKIPFWRNSQNSDARRDAQPHFLLVKNTFFVTFWQNNRHLLAVLAIFGKKLTFFYQKYDFIKLKENTTKTRFIRIFEKNTSQNQML